MADEPTALLDELRKLDEALIRANWFAHSVTVLNAIQLIRLLHGETLRLKAAGTECPCDCDVNDDGPNGCPL